MKAKVRQELKNNDKDELVKRLKESRVALTKANLEHRQFKLKNTSSLTNIRHEIAVILTLLKERELVSQKTEVAK